MSHVTDIVAVCSYWKTMEKVADLAGGFLSKRYESYGSLRSSIINYNNPHWSELQPGGKVGGANILWFTLNHQSSDDFVKLLKEQGITDVTLWIDDEYTDGHEVVQL